MENRTRTIVGMAKDVGLEVVSHYRKASRACVEVRAENGVTSEFDISCGSREDRKGDLIMLSRMRRFARTNALAPLTTADLETEEPVAKETLTLKKPEPVKGTRIELTPKEFYTLCEWVKATKLLASCALEQLCDAATMETGAFIQAEVMCEAMEATGTPAPEHWTAMPPAPELIARELATMMEALGTKPSALFSRYLKSLETA